MITPIRYRNQGVALIVVLSFVVLVAAVVVAFVSRAQTARKISASGTGGVRADSIAKAAMDVVMSDLKDEIVQGSGSDTAPFVPNNVKTIFPSKTAGGTNPNLLKVSTAGAIFAGDTGDYRQEGAHRGTGSTETPSANGRLISALRWSKSKFSTTSDGTTTDLPTPAWVYVTELGDMGYNQSGPKTTPFTESDITLLRANGTRPVVGRFAYMVYNVGSLLDINVAGNALTSDIKLRKGRLHQADISTIPGLTNAGDISDLLAWRNPTSPLPDEEATGGLFDPKRNFVTVAHPASDQIFLTRQDLIAYAVDKGLETALPYLTIFSREKNAPAWNTTATSTPPLNLPMSVVSKLKQRFPLSKIRMLSDDMTNEDIQKFFGLTWDEDDKVWVYKQKTPVLDKIRTLTELDSGEEPNFFEILKSIIVPSTLGTIPAGISTPAGSTFTVDEKKQDAHIFQIGANIIDQYDNNDFPIDIFVPLADTNVQNPANRFFGVENLPYLSRVAGVFQTAKDATTSKVTVDASILPEFMILHNDLKSGFNDIRLRVVGQASLLMGNATTLTSSATFDYTDSGATAAGKLPAGSKSQGVLPLKSYLSGLDAGVTHAWYNGQPNGTPPTTFSGIPVAAGQDAPIPSGSNPPPPFYAVDSGSGTGGTPLTFVLEYNAKTSPGDPDDYRPYAIWRDIKVGSGAPSAHPLKVQADNADGEYVFKTTALSAWVKNDPRTERQAAAWANMTLDLTSNGPVAVTSDHVNRAFRGVGDLSYVFRDEPNKNLDFNVDNSPDAALLEFFSVTDSTDSEGKVIAGRLALNGRSPEVFEAMLRGSAKTWADTAGLTVQEAKDAAALLTDPAKAAVGTRSELINRLKDNGVGLARVRALAEVANTRTWNVMIDVIAQAGRIPKDATGSISTKFMVEGERRYWMHVAIDRYTGQVVGTPIIEAVHE